MIIWNILRPFGIFSVLVCLDQEKSGNPGWSAFWASFCTNSFGHPVAKNVRGVIFGEKIQSQFSGQPFSTNMMA
jgi:hypothetical protein